ncbi:hypothetical protein HDZ31DRAFT_84380 [Schizophyllum fasciatum]
MPPEPPLAPVSSAAPTNAPNSAAQDSILARQTKLCTNYCKGFDCPQGNDCHYIHDLQIFRSQMRDRASGLERTREPRPHCWSYVQGHCTRGDACKYYHPQDVDLYHKYTPCSNWRACHMDNCTFRHPKILPSEDSRSKAPSPSNERAMNADSRVTQNAPQDPAQPHLCCIHALAACQVPEKRVPPSLDLCNIIQHSAPLDVPSPGRNRLPQTPKTASFAPPRRVMDADFEAAKTLANHARRASVVETLMPQSQRSLQTPRITVPVTSMADSSSDWRMTADRRRSVF